MAIEDKTEDTPEADEQRKNDGGSEGTGTSAGTTAGTADTPKTFSQAEVDGIVKARLAERDRTLKSKYEKQIEEKVAEARTAAQADLDKAIEERLTAKRAEEALAAARTAIKDEYGLSDAQLARVQGESPEELAKDAAELYAGLKSSGDAVTRKKPPAITPGNTGTAGGLPDVSRMSPAEIRANYQTLMAQVTAKR